MHKKEIHAYTVEEEGESENEIKLKSILFLTTIFLHINFLNYTTRSRNYLLFQI